MDIDFGNVWSAMLSDRARALPKPRPASPNMNKGSCCLLATNVSVLMRAVLTFHTGPCVAPALGKTSPMGRAPLPLSAGQPRVTVNRLPAS
jgi:hypothetical protein